LNLKLIKSRLKQLLQNDRLHPLGLKLEGKVNSELLPLQCFRSISDYQHWRSSVPAQQQGAVDRGLEALLTQPVLPGYCVCCQKMVAFALPSQPSSPVASAISVNWREELICPTCQLNNRVRFCFQVLRQFQSPARMASLYITEQVTPAFKWLNAQFPQAVGSEFCLDLQAQLQLQARLDQLMGARTSSLRSEDLTQLSFADCQWDGILSFDVLEHVPDYQQMLRECYRTLKPGGYLILTAPFLDQQQATLVRAEIDDQTRTIRHYLPPEYHGDPINEAGCLCFYHFGWDLLDTFQQCGFQDAFVVSGWSYLLGNLGNLSAFVALKA
jgi:Methyltransferase domain